MDWILDLGDGSEESKFSGSLYEADSDDGVENASLQQLLRDAGPGLHQCKDPKKMPTYCSEQWEGVQGNPLLEKSLYSFSETIAKMVVGPDSPEEHQIGRALSMKMHLSRNPINQ